MGTVRSIVRGNTMAVGVVVCLVMSLSACVNSVEPPPIPTKPTRPDMNQQLYQCVSAYLSSGSYEIAVNEGISGGILAYDPENDQYIIIDGSMSFATWAERHEIPIAQMRSDIVNHDECAYSSLDPLAEAEHQEREKAANECLDFWVNRHASAEALHYGITVGAITVDPATGLHHADPRSQNFNSWMWDNVPFMWSDLREEVIYGDGCPY